MDTIYITGHRNPDTDSIVSAMAYAALKNALGQRQYEAARLGQISDETQTVLDRFGFQPPKLLNNVRTQVRDLDYDTPATLSAAATISRAWRTMQKDKISAIPVANEDGTLFGMLSAGDVANYDMSSVRNPKVGEIPVYNLLSVLEGKILNQGGEMRDVISGEVTIALPASRENLVFSDPGSIVVCGDQPDMIRRALEIGVSCIIVCQAEVDPELLAMQTDTCIISTAYDAYRAVRLIYHAMPISSICKNKDLVCFHLDEKEIVENLDNTLRCCCICSGSSGKCQFYRKCHTCKYGNDCGKYSTEHVKYDNCLDDTAVRFTCVTQRTDNKKEYQKWCDRLKCTYKDISKDCDAGRPWYSDSEDSTENQSNQDSLYQSDVCPFVPKLFHISTPLTF